MDFENRESQRVSLERLPTNTTTDRHPYHRWYNFIAGYSPEFVKLCLECCGDDTLVLDPFAGMGTTQLVASQMGMKSVGFDPHPIFHRLASAKLDNGRTIEDVREIRDILISGINEPVRNERVHERNGKEGYIDKEDWENRADNEVSNVVEGLLTESQFSFLMQLFPKEVLEQLLGCREAIRKNKKEDDDLAFLYLSRMLEECTHSQTDGVYKAPDSKKKAGDPLSKCHEIYKMLEEDLSDDKSKRIKKGELVPRSSENMEQLADGSIGSVITSPPYLNNFDYAEMTRMLIYFWDVADNWGQISEKVREDLVVNTTTALSKVREENIQLKLRRTISISDISVLDEIVSDLSEIRKVKKGKKNYHKMVYPYFSQMTRIIKEIRRVAKLGCGIHIMIADAALYGVHIKTHEIIADMLEQIGFNDVSITFVRKRGHRWVLSKRDGAKEGLGEYYIYAER